MINHFPPLNALRVFEVAARKLSFSKAADELCVTQGAVSKQIQLLESYLSRPLFNRTPQGLTLTEAGKHYLPEITAAMQQIVSATAALQQARKNTLTLNISPSFSNLWLIPKLSELQHSLPDLKLSMVTGDGPIQFGEQEADLAIRCLPLSLNHEHATLLTEEILLPVVHCDLFLQNATSSKEALLSLPLILHTTRPELWTQFYSYLFPDSEAILSSNSCAVGFEHFFMSHAAILQKQGVGLLPDFMIESTLASSNLVNPFGIRYASGYGYYLLTSPYKAYDPNIMALKAWLTQQLTTRNNP